MKNTNNIREKTFLLTIFGGAMGFLEAVVVVYLRQLYYPEGFGFPVKGVILGGLFLEYLREIATIIMLLTVSLLAGRMPYERFSYFLYCFGVWDIFYYGGLKALLNWPPSLFTWDILFLIPVVWIAPVLAPIASAITMIIIAAFILYYHNKGYRVRISILEGSLMSAGFLIIFATFVWGHSEIIIEGGFLNRLLSLADDSHFQGIVTSYVPSIFHWNLFILGESLIFCSLAVFVRRMKSMDFVLPFL